jgi:hypothetical protein
VGARPRIRPSQVWLVSGILLVFGAIGVLLSWLMLQDALDHGDENSVVVTSAVNLAVAVAQVISGFLVFNGTEWGRRLAIGVSAVNLIGALILLVNGLGGQAMLGIFVNLVLVVALMTEKVTAWCRPRRRPAET